MISLYWMVLIPIVAGTLGMLTSLRVARVLTLLMNGAMMAASWALFVQVKSGGMVIQRIGGWTDFVGISLRADLLGAVMVMLTTLLFFFMALFNLRKSYVNNLFVFLFAVLEGLMIGIFLSNDLFNIFVLVEVCTVIISVMIMFKKDTQSIYDGMLYFFINIVAMTFFLFGIGMLYKTVGIIDLHGVRMVLETMDSPRPVILPYAFMITAVSLKAALMPLFSWLPKAHGTPNAPSIVSAILSGLYVKSGVYLFLRLQTAFSPVIDTSELFLVLGFITAVIGFSLALAQKDLKLILAYHTVSQIGLIMMGINMGTDQNYIGGIYHIVNHAFFKSTLFLTAGMIIDEYGTRNVYALQGVFRRMPLVSMATIFAIFGITGAPFFNGSISKYWIAYGAADTWVAYGLILVNLGTILSFVKYSRIFFGPAHSGKARCDHLREGVVLTMGTLCLLGGLFGGFLMEFLFGAQLPLDLRSYSLKMISFWISLAGGVLLYHGWLKRTDLLTRAKQFELSFNGVSLAITLFFTVMLAYLWVFVA